MSIEKFYDQFSEIFNRAVSNIGPHYMRFEAVGLLDGFMERTYAYELYHKLRSAQEESRYMGFAIHAEPQKRRTAFLRSIIDRLSGENDNPDQNDFQKCVMPDLLVHVPNDINMNIAILEVKPEKGQPSRGFAKDIRVLKEFVDGGESAQGYYKGISLLYHTDYGLNSEDEIKKRYADIIKETLGDSWEDYQAKILLLWHPAPGNGVIQIPW